jgi:hypothetical protein
MNRRGFLTSLLGTAAVAFDPEKALWVPGKVTYSIPAKEIWMPLATFNCTIAGRDIMLNGNFIATHANPNFKTEGRTLYTRLQEWADLTKIRNDDRYVAARFELRF